MLAVLALLLFLLETYWVLSGGASVIDLSIRDVVHAWATVPLTRLMQGITMFGSGRILIPLGAVAVWRFAVTRSRKVAIAFAAVNLSAQLASDLLKLAAHRTRPEVFFGLRPAETYSFPSGHAFLSTVFYGSIAAIWMIDSPRRIRLILAVGAVLAAGSIGFSRVYLGYHYPSDVLGGWTCGVGWLSLARLLGLPVDQGRQTEEQQRQQNL